MSALPQQPYLLRALYEWCVDSGYTPYISVRVDEHTRVPRAYVRDGQIVLNIGPNAVRNLHMDNDWVSFSARFGGQAYDIDVPVANVIAIYARETGEGMAFAALPGQAQTAEVDTEVADVEADTPVDASSGPPRPKGKPRLRVVK